MPLADDKTLNWMRELYQLGHAAFSAPGAQDAPQHLLRHLTDGFAAESGSLAVSADGGPEFPVAASIGTAARALDKELLDRMLAARAPLLEQDEDGSSMCWPLSGSGGIVGTLCVRRASGQPPFADDDLERGTALAGFLSIIVDNSRLHEEQARRIAELSQVNERLEETQGQLLQSEKMASIGQLAAGVAHEINNPIGYVHSNLGSLEHYVEDVFRILAAYTATENRGDAPAGLFAQVAELRHLLDVDFLKEDMHALLAETREGIARVKKIVQDLKDFSHAGGEEEWHWADLHKGLESTLNIVNNEIKYKAKVVKEYGQLPEIECLPSQLNQVFMNLLVNAAHAIESQGTITLRTGADEGTVHVEIADTGSGIAPENLKRIFEPFFTTKPVGKGTGLGLSLSYSIVQKHNGRIEVASEPGRGTTFRVILPRERAAQAA